MQCKVRVLLVDDRPLTLDAVLAMLLPKGDETESIPEGFFSFDGTAFSGTEASGNTGEGKVEPVILNVLIVPKPVLSDVGAALKSGVVASQTPNRDNKPAVPAETGAPELSRRECEVLKLIAEGMATKEVAYALSISCKTVGYHRANIRSKLGLRSTAQLTRYALAHSLA